MRRNSKAMVGKQHEFVLLKVCMGEQHLSQPMCAHRQVSNKTETTR